MLSVKRAEELDKRLGGDDLPDITEVAVVEMVNWAFGNVSTFIEQAERVAWRIEKDWLESQFAKIEATRVPLERIMMPYMIAADGRTFYELLVEKHKALPQGH